jgi:hypothetical protein
MGTLRNRALTLRRREWEREVTTTRSSPSTTRSARRGSSPNAKDIYYPGAPHGLTTTHQDQVNADLLTFLES